MVSEMVSVVRLLGKWVCLVLLSVSVANGKSMSHEYLGVGLGNVERDQIQSPPQSLQSLVSMPAPQQFPGEMDKETGIVNYDPAENTYEESGGPSVPSSMENALLNYLYTKHMIQKMKQQIEARTLQQQRKRNNGNYWKMCAFNAVSCFG